MKAFMSQAHTNRAEGLDAGASRAEQEARAILAESEPKFPATPGHCYPGTYRHGAPSLTLAMRYMWHDERAALAESLASFLERA